jgi:hypothetical protein
MARSDWIGVSFVLFVFFLCYCLGSRIANFGEFTYFQFLFDERAMATRRKPVRERPVWGPIEPCSLCTGKFDIAV